MAATGETANGSQHNNTETVNSAHVWALFCWTKMLDKPCPVCSVSLVLNTMAVSIEVES